MTVPLPPRPPAPPGPSFRDWAFLAISVILIVMALAGLTRNPRQAIFPLVFFGLCAVTFGVTILRKWRRQRFVATAVSVPGGVELRASRMRFLLIAAAIAAPAIIIFWLGDTPLLIRICGGIMLAASAVLLIGVVTGRIARTFLRFDPPGLTVGASGYEYLVPWDELVNISEGELYDNAVVTFDVADPAAIHVTPPTARDKVMKRFVKNKGLLFRHELIMTAQFAVPAEALCAALRNYAQNPAARAELVPRARIE